MNIRISTPGYIMVFSLMLIALATAIGFQLFDKSSIHTVFMKTAIEREKAQILALGGIQLALGQIEDKDMMTSTTTAPAKQPSTDKKEQPPKKDSSTDEQSKKLLEKILPVINRWQTITLQEKSDGIDAELSLCVCCENGKININELYDFNEHAFKNQGQKENDIKKALQILFSKIKNFIGGNDLFEAFEKFLKQRQYKLNDITELLAQKEFEVFKDAIFYEPSFASEKEKKEQKRKIYLMDIFTTATSSSFIDPWLLSDSLCGLFTLKRAGEDSIEEREQKMKEWLKSFKTSAKWAQDWKQTFVPIYGKEITSVPKEMIFMLNPKFEPMVFSVLSYAKIGTTTQKVFAIIERFKQAKNEAISVRVKKIYWL